MLIRDLTAGSRARLERNSDDQWVAREWQGEVLDRPVRLSVSEQSLADYLRAVGGDAETVFPDVDAEVAAYRLLLVHLDECFAGGTPTEIVVGAGGVTSVGVRPRPAVAPLDGHELVKGSGRWAARADETPPD